MAKWYDPLTERWHTMPEPTKRIDPPEAPEGTYDKIRRVSRCIAIWDAIVSTATATQMSKETECPVESIP